MWVALMSAILGGDVVVMLDQIQAGRSIVVPLIMIPIVTISLIYGAISVQSSERVPNTR